MANYLLKAQFSLAISKKLSSHLQHQKAQFSLAIYIYKTNSHWQFQENRVLTGNIKKPSSHWQYQKPNFRWHYFIKSPRLLTLGKNTMSELFHLKVQWWTMFQFLKHYNNLWQLSVLKNHDNHLIKAHGKLFILKNYDVYLIPYYKPMKFV